MIADAALSKAITDKYSNKIYYVLVSDTVQFIILTLRQIFFLYGSFKHMQCQYFLEYMKSRGRNWLQP